MTEDYVRSQVERNMAGFENWSTWDFEGILDATASAPGLDRLHHFVNSFLVGYQPFAADSLLEILHTVAICKTYKRDDLQYGRSR
ncbi:MAG: hypothetical protein JW937_02390 [Candidatus Omnitrophica bacterium]|nr:hypothetical protein [Candidatus Omnitrophota bacterium]